ncbi:MAG: DUF969 domain-containing protein [Gammaproteobacteria bacterium]|nr:DUF969 domain-containing protein [Gammaproteobacteria bacterium]
MNAWPLLGIALVVLGFALRMSPVLVVVGAGLATALLAGFSPTETLVLFGESFVKHRYLALVLLFLPALAVLERQGLREHVRDFIRKHRALSAGRLLLLYLGLRQVLAALGLTSLGGQAQSVRPLLAPMAEAAAQPATEAERQRILALCAATDNVGLFFGEDIFIAFGAVLLMQGFYAEHGLMLEPLQIALWGLPTALCAFLIHGLRVARLERLA